METQRIKFRLFQMPCCGQQVCWVNPRLPNHCPECGSYVFNKIREYVMLYDDDALLSLSFVMEDLKFDFSRENV